jgi:hypothetical protein
VRRLTAAYGVDSSLMADLRIPPAPDTTVTEESIQKVKTRVALLLQSSTEIDTRYTERLEKVSEDCAEELRLADSEIVVSDSGLSERDFFSEFFLPCTKSENPRFVTDLR